MKLLLVALTAAALSVPAAAADIARGATLTKTCVACHGADFNKPIDPSYPKLAGQHPDYLAHALTAYKRGNGVNGRNNPIMGAQVANLSDKDIVDIAAYLASLPATIGTGHR
ncbi:c-type cytochrome [Massilia sp. DWR3-1-1]|uniref:c-type cytochrome n=1 Tax=Massilia sp. DWR3-1-1 TaxID=2804559 RepID=UPI003CEDCEF3